MRLRTAGSCKEKRGSKLFKLRFRKCRSDEKSWQGQLPQNRYYRITLEPPLWKFVAGAWISTGSRGYRLGEKKKKITTLSKFCWVTGRETEPEMVVRPRSSALCGSWGVCSRTRPSLIKTLNCTTHGFHLGFGSDGSTLSGSLDLTSSMLCCTTAETPPQDWDWSKTLNSSWL